MLSVCLLSVCLFTRHSGEKQDSLQISCFIVSLQVKLSSVFAAEFSQKPSNTSDHNNTAADPGPGPGRGPGPGPGQGTLHVLLQKNGFIFN